MDPSLPFIKELQISSKEDTLRIAIWLAQQTQKNDHYLLDGDLGVGKTTLARFYIQSLLGEKITVQSPTFPIMLPYETRFGTLWHMDLYRLSRAEVKALHLEDYWKNSLAMIEWPDRIDTFPPEVLHLQLNHHTENQRSLRIFGDKNWSKRWKDYKS